jgi:2-polyprenyl-6-methoxyphenol hydroxylase-like FAD-dependent oxidoreductase
MPWISESFLEPSRANRVPLTKHKQEVEEAVIVKVAINGAGIAGPTLAYWLLQYGHEPVLIEAAGSLRRGGYIVDFWGIGYEIAERMGIIPGIRRHGYQVQEVRLVDREGHKEGGFTTDVFTRTMKGRFTSVRRSDISAAIYAAVEGRMETMFGDSIVDLSQHASGIRVVFKSGQERDFDLAIGADGLHSSVREIAFGFGQVFEKFLGYYVAAFEVSGYRPRDELVYISHAEPGRQVSRFSMRDDRTLFLFVFRGEYLPGEIPEDNAGRRSVLEGVFMNTGWESGQILDALSRTQEIYFDRVSQIKMQKWSSGRVALLGDAAACVSLLAGEGTGLAIAEAYVLAGEIARSGANYRQAFSNYEKQLMPFVQMKQASAAQFASSFAPRTAFGVTVRNWATRLMAIPGVASLLIGRSLRDDITLPDYSNLPLSWQRASRANRP